MYEDAWARVMAEQERLAAGDPVRTARLDRLLTMRKTIEDEMQRLDIRTARWFDSGKGHDPYLSGFAMTAGPSEPVNRRAAIRLADDLFHDLLEATRYVRADTKRVIAEAAKIAAESTVVENTAQGAARDIMAKMLRERGIAAVRYANGARHGLAEYSEMVIRTKTALAFNRGTLDGAPDVQWWELFDGPDCGLSSHDDTTLANGLIVERGTVQSYPISHPRCRRAAGPRPDITSERAAKKAQAPREDREADAVHAVG
jgi:hypothetical protein